MFLAASVLAASMLPAPGPAAAQAADGAKKPHVVFVTGDDEYRSEITMPMIAKILEAKHNMRTSVAFARPTPQTKDNIEGLEALKDADLAVMFVRFRKLPDDQLKLILDYADSGKPLVGLRTSTHAFLYSAGDKHVALNDTFGRDVWGQKWLFHNGHRSSTDVQIIEAAKDNPVLRGVEPAFHCRSWLYHVLPLEGDCTPLLMGKAVDSEQKESVANPVAWTKSHKGGRVFFTTLGHPDDFKLLGMRRLLINGILWSLGQEIPAAGANAEIQGDYVAPPTT
jgi:type 1 glutamine amidotransferase